MRQREDQGLAAFGGAWKQTERTGSDLKETAVGNSENRMLDLQ
jgi:hypothetical protein